MSDNKNVRVGIDFTIECLDGKIHYLRNFVHTPHLTIPLIVPYCEGDTPAAPHGSTLLPLRSGTAAIGSWAEYACESDTKLKLVAKCEEDGTWSNVFGECP